MHLIEDWFVKGICYIMFRNLNICGVCSLQTLMIGVFSKLHEENELSALQLLLIPNGIIYVFIVWYELKLSSITNQLPFAIVGEKQINQILCNFAKKINCG